MRGVPYIISEPNKPLIKAFSPESFIVYVIRTMICVRIAAMFSMSYGEFIVCLRI